MAAKTFYLKDALASGSNYLSLQDGGVAPAQAMTSTGWRVGTIGTNRYNLMDSQTEVVVLTGDTSGKPASNPDNTIGDCFRSENTLYGIFEATAWTIAIQVIGETQATGTQDGRLRYDIWKSSNADGSSPTKLTSAVLQSSAYTNLANSVYQTLSITWTPSDIIQFANEYLFIQVAHQITGAGNNAQCDCHIAVSSSSKITTSDFIAAPDVRVTHAGAYVETERKALSVTHAGAYVETERKAISVTHVGVYLEIETHTMTFGPDGQMM